jgi:hypothetical protein
MICKGHKRPKRRFLGRMQVPQPDSRRWTLQPTTARTDTGAQGRDSVISAVIVWDQSGKTGRGQNAPPHGAPSLQAGGGADQAKDR